MDSDFLSNLQGKVQELKGRRQELTQSQLTERMSLNQIEEQLSLLQA